MQAVILAGGLGTRLRPLTEKIPKVMAPVNGKPFLAYLLELLANYHVTDIVLCTGYLGNQVKEYFGNGDGFGVRIEYSDEKEKLLGTGGALKQAQGLLGDYFFVINGDTYLPIDYVDVANAFMERGKKALMVVYGNRQDSGVNNNIRLDDELLVIEYNKKNASSGLKLVDAGVLVLKKTALACISEGTVISLEDGLYQPLIQQKELAAFTTGSRFYDIGTPERQKLFEDYLKRTAR